MCIGYRGPCCDSVTAMKWHRLPRDNQARTNDHVQNSTCTYGPYLQTAEDGEQVVEGHDVAVDGQQPQQPGGADEQQQQEGHPESRAGTHTHTHMNT